MNPFDFLNPNFDPSQMWWILNYLNDPYANQGLDRTLSGMNRASMIRDADVARLLEAIRGIDPRMPIEPRSTGSFGFGSPLARPNNQPTVSPLPGLSGTVNTTGANAYPTRGTNTQSTGLMGGTARVDKEPYMVKRDVGGMFPASLVDYFQQVNPQGLYPTRRI